VNPLGHPVAIADSPHLPELIAGTKATAVLADKGYDADTNRDAIRAAGAEPCIPPRKNRVVPVEYDRHLYKERSAVELFFGRIKQYRRVATRYDKKAANFLGFVWLASIAIMLA
jgi:transposase